MAVGNALRPSGFTLLELMFAIGILAILSAIAAPSFASLISKNEVTLTTNSLVGSLQSARQYAVSNRTPVTVCAVSEGETCASTTDWSTGWIIVADDTVLHFEEDLPSRLILSSSHLDGVTFRSSGTPNRPIEFQLQAAGYEEDRHVCTRVSGITRSGREGCH